VRTRLASAIVRLVVAALLLPLALDWRSPLLASVRPSALAILIIVPLSLVVVGVLALRRSGKSVVRAFDWVALLAAGIWFRSLPLRIASAAVVMLTVLKVFLIDMSDLTGIYRALSFLGLGAVLIGIGWFYQRLLFPRRSATASEEPSQG